MNIENNLAPAKSSKKTGLVIVISLVSISLLTFLGVTWKKHSDGQKEIISNRVKASKLVIIGKPLPENFEKEVDLSLLEKDAEEGNQLSKEILELYRHRKAANESIALGKATPKNVSDSLDLTLLKADADAGNKDVKRQLNLIAQRKLVAEHIQLGKEIPSEISSQINMKLLRQDAEAGNSEMKTAWTLVKNRNEAAARCVLGKPFSFDFYDHVDRALLEQDAQAGYAQSEEILKLANNRIKADELTIQYKPYPEDFFEPVDRDLLVADADAGNADMQYIWARYHDGKGPKKDRVILKKYYTLASAQSHAEAQCNLAHYYQEDEDDQNISKALELYTLSANSGHDLAQNNLGALLLSGMTGSRDVKKAMEWFTKAANSGNMYAQYSIGLYLCEGRNGLKKDLKAGTTWMRKSIDQGNLSAIHNYHHYTQFCYPREERFKLQIEVLGKGAKLNHPYSMGWYGRMMINGDGIKKDRVEGAKWVQKSAALNDYHGLADLADIYRHGVGASRQYA
jgi:TPR repeat protein